MIEKVVKVAAVQAAPALLDIEKSVSKTIMLMDEAGASGVQLIVFPETWISGYPWWIWLGTPANTIHHAGDYVANSIEVGDQYDQRLQEAADRNNLHAIIGVSEKSGGSLYMGQWHYGPDGSVISRRRKLKPTHVERAVFGEGDGSDLIVSETDVGNVGALCCWEHMQPLTKYALYSENEEIHAAAWPAYSVYNDITYALSAELNMNINQVYAAEGQCFVVAATAVITPELQDMLCKTDDERNMIKLGGGYARVFGPDGAPIGTPLDPQEEGLLITDINLGKIAYCKAAADPAGHYSRPDVTRLLINREVRRPVVSFSEAEGVTRNADARYDQSVEEARQETLENRD
jgi:aliphatic nitrilase